MKSRLLCLLFSICIFTILTAQLPSTDDLGFDNSGFYLNEVGVDKSPAVPYNQTSTESRSWREILESQGIGNTYGIDLRNGNNLVYFNLQDPSIINTVGTSTTTYAADFGPNNVLYAIDNATLNLVTIDTSSGATTIIGPSSFIGNPTGLSFDYTTNTMYFSSTDGATSYLYTADLNSGVLTQIGPVIGLSLLIEIAVSNDGFMYGHDIGTDSLYLIDKTTGNTTGLGPTGVNASYAQGMDFDPNTNTLYLAAYISGGLQELRIADLITGNTTLVGRIGGPSGNVEIDGFAIPLDHPQMIVQPRTISDTLLVNEIATHLIMISNPSLSSTKLNFSINESPSVNWLSVNPVSGSIGPDSSQMVEVTLDATNLPTGPYAAELIVSGNDPTNPADTVSVGMRVNPAPMVNFTPDTFSFSLSPGEADSLNLNISNSGAGPLNYDLIPTSGSATIFGRQVASGALNNTDIGNIFYISSRQVLIENKIFLNITQDTELHFFVYQGATLTGTFDKISELTVPNSGTGEKFYSSGPISVPLAANTYYYIGVSFGGNSYVTYYIDGMIAVPIPASFGSLMTAAGVLFTYPPPPSINNTIYTSTPPIYCSLTMKSWLTFDPATGIIPSGSNQNIKVKADARELVGGQYHADIIIRNNDPLNPNPTAGVYLLVDGPVSISASPNPLIFPDTVFVNDSDILDLWIKNNDIGLLSVTNITSNNPVFTFDKVQFNVGGYDSAVIQVTFTPTTAGTETGLLNIFSDDTGTPLLPVAIVGQAALPPIISIDPQNIWETLDYNDSVDVQIQINNSGVSKLYWSAYVFPFPPEQLEEVVAGEEITHHEILGYGHSISIEELFDRISQFEKKNFLKLDNNGPLDNDLPSSPNKIVEDFYLGRGLGEIFGSTQYSYTGNLRGRGNIFSCTVAKTLIEHRFYLNPTDTTTMWFIVAEADTQVGDYQLINVSEINGAGPGEGWYGSGPLSVQLIPGKFYLIFTQWEGNATYYNEQNISPYPIQTSFGELLAGAGWNWGPAYQDPPLPTHSIPAIAFGDSVAYYQTIVTENFVKLLEPTSGIIDPSSNGSLTVRLLAVYNDTTLTSGILLQSNDPLSSAIFIPVKLDVGFTGIEPQSQRPLSYRLEQNFPNPFNPLTSIKFELPVTSEVSLVIYNILGQKIRTLINKKIPAGYHQAIWDGRNDEGNQVSGGIYIYKFKCSEYTAVRKMVLMK